MVRKFFVSCLLCFSMNRGTIMWGEVLCLFLGAALVLGAILGKRFYAGLSPKARVPIPKWQGRAWWVSCCRVRIRLTSKQGC